MKLFNILHHDKKITQSLQKSGDAMARVEQQLDKLQATLNGEKQWFTDNIESPEQHIEEHKTQTNPNRRVLICTQI